jgi:glucokinase
MPYTDVNVGSSKISVAETIGHSCENATRSLILDEGYENQILDLIKNAISKSIDKDVEANGIGISSFVDRRLRTLCYVENTPSWKKVYLNDFLENHLNISLFVKNDTNCFSLGELYFGARENLDSFLALTIGTEFAGGIIINKKLYSGSNSDAGEFEMFSYLDTNFEDYCSGQFFQKIHGIAGEKVFSNAKAGDAEALSLYSTFGKHLGNLIIQVLYTFDPETIILGGSVSKAYTHFRSGIQLSLNQFAYQNSISNLKIILSSDPDISVKGAAALCY